MTFKCVRCGKEIVSPDQRNADYIILPTKLTAIICPACYLPDDLLIWGYHKENEDVAALSKLDRITATIRRFFGMGQKL